MRDAVKSALRGQPRLARALAGFARGAGAGAWAGRLMRYGEDIAPAVSFAVTDNLGNQTQARMRTRGGMDQVARDVWAHGWTRFEAPLPEVFAASARRCSGLVVDVGANTGFYSLLAAACGRDVRVHAFEPFAPVIEMLRENLAMNETRERIEVYPVALSDEPGETVMYVPRGAYDLVETSCSLSEQFEHRAGGTLLVPVTTLDAHVASKGVERVGLLKVDVEGVEHRVLRGAAAVLEHHRPIVCFELLPVGDAAAIEAIRRRHSYVVAGLGEHRVEVGGSVRVRETEWNQVLVPAEALDDWIASLPSHLRVHRSAG